MSRKTPPTSATLRHYFKRAFEALSWKLEGLSEHDLRRPLVPTGTNLLGIAKHVAIVSAEYCGPVLGRETVVPIPPEDAEPNSDLWAREDESAEYVRGLLATAAAEVDAALVELPLDAPANVPWWAEHGETTFEVVAIHLLAEVHRHAGHADLVRELVDGRAGLLPSVSNLPDARDGADEAWWAAYRERLQTIADSFR